MILENKKLITTNHDLTWHLIDAYLEGFKTLNIDMDIEFKRLFNELRNYVNSKLKFNGKGDVIAQYVVTQQIPLSNQEYQDWLKKNDSLKAQT